MKVCFAQINSKVCDLKYNASKLCKIIFEKEALSAEQKPDLIVFPEMALLGYTPKDLLFHKGFRLACENILREELINKITIPTLISSIHEEAGNLYNAGFFIENKQIKKIIHKKLLPNYEVFNEKRYFQKGLSDDLENYFIQVKNQNLAILICEDLLGLENDFYFNEFNTLKKLKDLTEKENKKLDSIICLSASPFRAGQPEKRLKILEKAQQNYFPSTNFVLVNQVGGQDNLIFDGNSLVLNKNAELIYQAKSFEEEIKTIDLNEKQDLLSPKEKISEIKQISEALILGIQDYFVKTGFQKAFIGISGGIDSALVACLAERALGAENVFGIMMPSKYSSKGSISDSESLLANLKIKSKCISIEEILQVYLKQLNLSELTLAEENLQSRIRGATLMALANSEGALVLATGNKSEFAVGYATLYGDMCGAIAPIGDLYKTQVQEISKLFSEIPNEIIVKAPSAELRPNQKDIDSLPDYAELDQILKLYIEDKLNLEEIIEKGFSVELTKKVINLIKKAEFKRQQAPIILKVSSCAFGSDWLYSVVSDNSTL
jgi:NAD+ synthase (glutamine-hydrolysing)